MVSRRALIRRSAVSISGACIAGGLAGCVWGDSETTPVDIALLNNSGERAEVVVTVANLDERTLFEQTVHVEPSVTLSDREEPWTVPITTVSDVFVVGEEYRFTVGLLDGEYAGQSRTKRVSVECPEEDGGDSIEARLRRFGEIILYDSTPCDPRT